MPASLAWREQGRGLDWPPTAYGKAESGLARWEEIMKHAYIPRTTTYNLNPGEELNDLRMSDEVASAVRARQEIHPRNRRPDVGRIRKARREEDRPLELYAGPARRAAEGQGQGQGSGPVELLPARRRDRPGPHQPRLRLHRRRARQESAGVGDPELLGARHRQHGSAGARRHARAEGEVAEAAAQRRDPLGLRHDRAGRRLVRRQEHLDHAPSSSATSG